ncbi:MAG: aspartyl/asparaginyl beta-hydroxylase domain-containing protein [Asticcacaulis sp.]
MNFAGEYRRIGSADVSALQAAVSALSDEDWSINSGRQQVYKVHAHTQTIPLIFDSDMRHTTPTVHADFHRFQPLLQPMMDTIAGYFAANPPAGIGPGTRGHFQRLILVRLAGLASIGSHRDFGASLSRAHRIHLPLVTSEKALFAIAGDIRHLRPGEIWEINNRKAHAVRNDSGQPRIHAIFDYVLPGEIVSDPDGQLVA